MGLSAGADNQTCPPYYVSGLISLLGRRFDEMRRRSQLRARIPSESSCSQEATTKGFSSRDTVRIGLGADW